MYIICISTINYHYYLYFLTCAVHARFLGYVVDCCLAPPNAVCWFQARPRLKAGRDQISPLESESGRVTIRGSGQWTSKFLIQTNVVFSGLALWKRSEGDPGSVVSRQVDRLMMVNASAKTGLIGWQMAGRRPNLHQEPGAAKDAARAAKVQWWHTASVWGSGSYQLTKVETWNIFLEVQLDSSQFLCFFFWEFSSQDGSFSRLEVKGGLIASIV